MGKSISVYMNQNALRTVRAAIMAITMKSDEVNMKNVETYIVLLYV